MTRNDNIALDNGVELPTLGLGVFQTPPDETRAAVEAALATGYRHIDTAAAYGNERQVGEAPATAGVGRSGVFVETKIWISDYGYDETLHGFEKSAGKLGVDQIDLLILHQPLPTAFDRTLESYRALEKLLGDGRVRAIGGGPVPASCGGALMRKIVGFVALSLACCAQAGAADTLLTYTREAPEIVFNGHVTGGRETVHVLVGPDRARIDEPRRATILREDQGELYFVVNPLEPKRRERIAPAPGSNPGEVRVRELGPSTYVVRFPVKLRDELPAETYKAIVESEPHLTLQARTVDRQRTKKIGHWQAAEHRIELVDPAGHVRAAATVWTTAELPSKTFAPLQQLQEAVAAMNPRPERLRLAQEIDKLPGVPVRVESTFEELAGTVTRSLELGAIEEKAATAADYEPPKETYRRDFLMFYGSAYHDL